MSGMYKMNQLSSTQSGSNLLSYNKMNNNNFINNNSSLKQNNHNSSSLSNNKFKSNHLGLNPNLLIQDQYIENLLKQIHFMNMQVKLLKQKQSQSESNNLWGIINRTNQPLVKNIIVSQQKYQDMKRQTDFKQQQLINQNIRLADQQNAILKEYQYLEEKLIPLKRKKKILLRILRINIKKIH